MKFILIEEIRIRKFQSLLNDISEEDDSILTELELMAIDEITSYLRPRYDTDYIFSRTGLDRSSILRRITTDYLMCFLWERTNSNEIPDSMVERCEKNTAWLKDVAKGLISPDLPLKDANLELTNNFQGDSESVFNNINSID